MSDARPAAPEQQRTLQGVFAPTWLALVPAASLVAMPRIGWSGTANLLIALSLAAVVSVGTALCLAAAATDATPGAQPARTILQRSLGRGVGAAVAFPMVLARPFLAAFALLAADQVAGSMLGEPAGIGTLGLLGVLAALALVGALAPRFLSQSRLPASALLGGSVALSLLDVFWTGWNPGWVPGASLDPELVLGLAVPALIAPIGGADGTAVLTDPRRSFPAGTLWAVGLAGLLALVVTSDPSAFQPSPTPSLVATLARVGMIPCLLWTCAASLGGAAAALREALGEGWLPGASGPDDDAGVTPWVGAVGMTVAMCVTGDLGVVGWALSVALLLTAVGINVSVLVPLWLQLPSFRPTVRLPLWVPALAALAACLILALLAPPTAVFGLVAMGLLYLRGERTAETAADQSALLPALLGRATASEAGREAPRAWTPRILVPLAAPTLTDDERWFLLEAVRPEGALHLLGVTPSTSTDETLALEDRLDELADSLRAEGVSASRAVMTAPSRVDGAAAALQVLQGTFPAPGLVYVRQADTPEPELGRLVATARRARVGVLWLDLHPDATLGGRRAVNLWVRPHVEGWEAEKAFELGHVDLALLTCLRLQRNLGVRVTLVAAVATEAELPRAHAFLSELATVARLPSHSTRTVALVGELPGALKQAPPADLHVLGLPPDPDPSFARRLRDEVGASVLLLAGSGRESARA